MEQAWQQYSLEALPEKLWLWVKEENRGFRDNPELEKKRNALVDDLEALGSGSD